MPPDHNQKRGLKMAKQNVADVAAPKMKIVVAEPGKFVETVRLHANSPVAVLPYGADWSPVIESDDPFDALLTAPISREVAHG